MIFPLGDLLKEGLECCDNYCESYCQHHSKPQAQKEIMKVCKKYSVDKARQRQLLIDTQHEIDGRAKYVDAALFQLEEFVGPIATSRSDACIKILDVIISALFSSKDGRSNQSRRAAAKVLGLKSLRYRTFTNRLNRAVRFRNGELSHLHDNDHYSRNQIQIFNL